MLRGVNRCAPLERWLGVRLRVRGDSCGAANLAVSSTRYSETSAWCRIWPRWVCILRIFGRRARHLRRKSNDPSPAPHPRTESCAILRTRRRRTDCGSTADRRAPCADGTVIRDRNRPLNGAWPQPSRCEPGNERDSSGRHQGTHPGPRVSRGGLGVADHIGAHPRPATRRAAVPR